jgi:hypothetical protein
MALGDIEHVTHSRGTGKSSVILALAALGYPALEVDEPGCSEYAPDGDWIWHEERVQAFLLGRRGRPGSSVAVLATR